MRLALLAACCLLGGAAPDRPAPLPTRDVDVTYQSRQGEVVLEQRSRFTVQAQRMRLDMPTPGLYMIVDYKTRTMAVVSDGDRGVLEMAAPAGAAPGLDAAASYARRGEDRVAGLACTEWETRDSQGQASWACFTADGVMLRARRGDKVLAIATRVAYAPNDPGLFTIPPDYRRTAGRANR
jgi:hypothetical protein